MDGCWQTIPYSWTGMAERSFSKNSLQPRHSAYCTASRPESWSGSGGRNQLHTITEVVRALSPVDVMHQDTHTVDTVFLQQPVQLMEHRSNVFVARNSSDKMCHWILDVLEWSQTTNSFRHAKHCCNWTAVCWNMTQPKWQWKGSNRRMLPLRMDETC